METIDQNENPYVAVVSRKSRNLKKKLERVIKVEAQLKEGKKLNEEQLVLVASKSSLEKSLSDVESIKTQLEEVAKQELLLKKQQQKQEQQQQKQKQQTVTQENRQTETVEAEKTDSSTATHEVHVATNSTQSELQDNNVTSTSNPVVDFSEVLRGHLVKLLKLFHVCSRYSTLSGGNPLPPDINYFGKCLLGETTVDSFTKALNQSVKNAELYLDEVLGSQYEAIRGMSYSQISNIIDSLALQLPQPESSIQHAPTPPPQSPQINFFADGDINEESFNPSSTSPFPLPPSAIVMYDQWNNDQNIPPVSPSTLVTSALSASNVEVNVESTSSSNDNQNSEVVENSSTKKEEENVNTTDNTKTENRESGGRRGGRGYSRGRGGKGRGKSGRSSSKENNTQSNEGGESQSEVKEFSEVKKGISWGGQQKKAGGALATVSGAPEATTTGSSSTPTNQEKEGGRGGRGGGRGRGRWSSGRGRGAKESESSNNNNSNNNNNNNNSTEGTSTTKRTSYSKTSNNTTDGQNNHNNSTNTTDNKGRGSGGRGNGRGRGRISSRGDGRGGNGGRFHSREKPATQPSTA